MADTMPRAPSHHDLAPGRPSQRLQHALVALYRRVQESEVRAGHGHVPSLAIEVHRDVLGDARGLLAADALVQRSLVDAQARCGFQGLMEARQPGQQCAAVANHLALAHLVQRPVQCLGAVLGIGVQVTVAGGAAVQLQMLPQLGPFACASALLPALAAQILVDGAGDAPDVAEHLGLLASQRRGGQLQHGALQVTRQVHDAEHRVVLSVDGCEPARNPGRAPREPVQLHGVHVLHGYGQAHGFLVALVEHDVLIFAAYAHGHDIGAQLRRVVHHRAHQTGCRPCRCPRQPRRRCSLPPLPHREVSDPGPPALLRCRCQGRTCRRLPWPRARRRTGGAGCRRSSSCASLRGLNHGRLAGLVRVGNIVKNPPTTILTQRRWPFAQKSVIEKYTFYY